MVIKKSDLYSSLWASSLPSLHHGAAALPAAQAVLLGGCTRALLQHRPGADLGGLGHAGRPQRETCVEALERFWRIRAQGALFFRRVDSAGRPERAFHGLDAARQ